jgi:hypothetical protein
MFTRLGFGGLVHRARSGARRADLAAAVPADLLAQIGALGNARELAGRVAAYRQAGADHVGIVPSTAEDPAGRRVMDAVLRVTVTREEVAG